MEKEEKKQDTQQSQAPQIPQAVFNADSRTYAKIFSDGLSVEMLQLPNGDPNQCISMLNECEKTFKKLKEEKENKEFPSYT